MTASQQQPLVSGTYGIVVVLAAFLLHGTAFTVVVVVGAMLVGLFFASGVARPAGAGRDRQRRRNR